MAHEKGKVRMDSIARVTKEAGQLYTEAVAPTNTDRLGYDGYLYATKTFNPQYNDLAEYFLKGEETEPGDIVVLYNGKYVKSDKRADTMVRGVHSDTYGHCLGGDGEPHPEERYIPLALSGRVRVKIIGLAEPGEWVVTDMYNPGVGISLPNIIPGAVIGQIEEKKTTLGIGRVWMFVKNM